MPRSSFQKLKIIYIMEYLLKNSDEDHAVTTYGARRTTATIRSLT